jgi:prepilin-type N-terminal cleavage/methylation domain-containing protein
MVFRRSGAGEPRFGCGADRGYPHLNGGFTLIELMVVMIALVILAAAVVPALHGAAHQQDLSEVATRVAASARYARDEAASRQETIVLSVETSPPAVLLAVDTSGMTGETAPGSMSAPGTMSAPGGMGASSPTAALPATYALIRLPTQVQAHLEAVPETLNGSIASTGTSSSPLEMLRFPPDGRTTGGMVVLTDARGHTMRVTVAPDIGTVKVTQGSG